ncbi:MAG: bifunctional phosphoribosylaminoimidazolecarboxamide formyltransferase/IMP cyclohydrolase [Planctomycetes bacterium]|jgi:phosphoribosylaminoimidazolecarboxamide formyltransferase/IMP cyclohydrolase|nr:bifunctional phosphoribosylaminoimidazolecarboxamide formyltransferase/IMP cyclohydrolase [Planctomycetota bacterium]
MENQVRRALVSVYDKTGLEGFVRLLVQRGVEVLSTGGTYKALRAAGIAVREVSEVTQFPEIMHGRVKTLHPRVHGGILARRDDPSHLGAMKEHGIGAIDLVVVNLYPFEATVAKEGVTRDEAVEQIDIGGPSMVRSAAKNHAFVGVVVDPADYGRVLADLEANQGALTAALRRELAVKAFTTTSRYDAAISSWLFRQELADGRTADLFPEAAVISGSKVGTLRYGENPHQSAAFYRTRHAGGPVEPSVAGAELLGGKQLSYNNLVDLDAALALAKEFDGPFVAVTKHNNPCGAAAAATIAAALEKAWAGDPISAFGSVLAFTRTLDLASAQFLVSGNRFVEAIIAPAFDDEALELLTQKPKWGKSVRLLACGPFGPSSRRESDLEWKQIVGGFLLQTRDLKAEGEADCKVVTRTAPTAAQLEGLIFANRIAKHVKSNAIAIAAGTEILGVGAGQMSRVDSVRLAVHKSGERVRGSVLASDAFFPFPDGVEAAIAAGVTAILQPGGSVRDAEVIAACDKAGVPMVFTSSRHFRH